MSRTDIIALLLVVFAFRGEIMEYGKPFLDRFTQINSVVEIDKPDQDNLDLVRSTQLDDRDYTAHDKLMLAVFHDQLADDLQKLDSANNQDLMDHHVQTLTKYVMSNKVEKKYEGLTDDIETIFRDTFGDKVGSVDKETVDEYSDTCRAIAWVLIND